MFALRDIKKSEYLYCNGEFAPALYEIPLDRLAEIRPEVLGLILDRWPQIKQGRPFFSPNADQNLMSFMNHSSTPNSQQSVAIHDIQAGEEITEDYDTGNLSDLQKQHYSFI